MQSLKLAARKRQTAKEGAKELTNDDVRGVVYGREVESTPIAATYLELEKLYREAGTNHLVELEIDGGQTHDVLFKDVQLDPVSNQIQHFDLYAVKKGEKITAEVPIELVGDSPAVMRGAQLSQILDNLEVQCVPSKLPDKFTLDITVLEEIGDTLSVADIPVEEGIDILADPDQTIAKTEEIRELEVEEEVAEVEGEEDEEGEEGEGGEDADEEAGEEAESKE